jgi:iron(III) transport system ATP-binding protein
MTVATPAMLEFDSVGHAYGSKVAVEDFSLALVPGEVACLLGPSGCGKSTLLRLAAGLESPARGRIRIDGRTVSEPGRVLAPERRGVGLVFQDFALFPHLSVEDNVAFGLSGAGRREVARAMLARVGLVDRARSFPHMLSGGQQQRVALARALAPRPRVMLLDEPFSSLDARLREALREETLALLRESGAATLMVTHDPDEAMALSDRIAVMRDGRLLQVGSPADIYHRPIDAFTAAFLGEVNELPGQVRSGRVETVLGAFAAPAWAEGAWVTAMVRPEAVRLDLHGRGQSATVADARQIGEALVLRLVCADGTRIRVRQIGGVVPAAGSNVGLVVDPDRLMVFPAAR